LPLYDVRDGGADDLQYDNEFWRFSLAVYEQVDVAQECLALQQAIGVDVNLLLFCAWVGTHAIALSRAEIEEASNTVAAWHEHVVRPLRGARKQVKMLHRDDFESFRTKVKGIELEAEQIEQAILFGHSKRIKSARTIIDCRDAIAQNVKIYIASMSGALTARASELSAPHLVVTAERFKQS